MADGPEKSVEEIALADGRYPLAAYAFLRDGIGRAERNMRSAGDRDPDRQVTGEQFCTALRGLAVERWGGLTRAVLASWNIRATIDFGNMVYLLIEHQHWHKSPEDSLEDFRAVYDFQEAFTGGEDFELVE